MSSFNLPQKKMEKWDGCTGGMSAVEPAGTDHFWSKDAPFVLEFNDLADHRQRVLKKLASERIGDQGVFLDAELCKTFNSLMSSLEVALKDQVTYDTDQIFRTVNKLVKRTHDMYSMSYKTKYYDPSKTDILSPRKKSGKNRHGA